MNHTKEERDQRIRQYISDFKGSNSNTKDNNAGKEDQGASNFYLDIEYYPSYDDDPKAEAFWTKFAKGEGQKLRTYLSVFFTLSYFLVVASICISRGYKY